MREYFRNIRQNRIKLRMAQKRLRDMQENMAAISSPDLSGMPKGSRSSGDAKMMYLRYSNRKNILIFSKAGLREKA